MDSPTQAPLDAPRRRFHRETWNQLTAIDARLLDALAFLARLKGKTSPTNARYATPGRRWLAAHLDCSVETITRHTTKLARLGLLTKLQRRPQAGQWQTNLYRLVSPMAWQAAALVHHVRAAAHRLSKVPHIGLSVPDNQTPQRQKESLREIIERGLARWGPSTA